MKNHTSFQAFTHMIYDYRGRMEADQRRIEVKALLRRYELLPGFKLFPVFVSYTYNHGISIILNYEQFHIRNKLDEISFVKAKIFIVPNKIRLSNDERILVVNLIPGRYAQANILLTIDCCDCFIQDVQRAIC